MAAPSTSKVVIFMILGLCIPIFLIVMAYLAAKSDAQTQQKYQQQHSEIAKRHGLPDPYARD